MLGAQGGGHRSRELRVVSCWFAPSCSCPHTGSYAEFLELLTAVACYIMPNPFVPTAQRFEMLIHRVLAKAVKLDHFKSSAAQKALKVRFGGPTSKMGA